MKKFYIETFGCQMNAHDSEKVVGTLIGKGYNQVATVEEAELVLYNTCSIRDKAEQKVFHRLNEFKRDSQDKVFAVIGCVAQQEGTAIFDKAPHVSLVAGSASYHKLPEMLIQIASGQTRVTGLAFDNEDSFEVPYTKRDNPHKAFLTIIEGCDKSCAYCVVPFTRGPERSRTSAGVVEEARALIRDGYSEITLLGQNVNSYRDPSPAGDDFATLLRRLGEVDGLKRLRFTTSHPRDFVQDIIHAIDENPILCNHVHLPVQSGSTRILDRMQRLYTREEYMRRIDWMRSARRPIAITTDIIVGFPGETEQDLEDTFQLLDVIEYDALFAFKYSKRPNTPALEYEDHLSEEEKGRRLAAVQERQRAIQIRRNAEYIGSTHEVMIDGYNKSIRQWLGKTTQNKTIAFTHPHFASPEEGGAHLMGSYCNVRVLRSGPQSLGGEVQAESALP